MIHDRLPPHSIEAEKVVIGSMIRDNEVIGDIYEILNAEDFYHDAHQRLFQSIVELYSAGFHADMVLVREDLKRRKWLDDIGGHAYLVELWEGAPTAANSDACARTVRSCSIARKTIHVATEAIRSLYDSNGPVEDIQAELEQKLFDIGSDAATRRNSQAIPLQEATYAVIDRLDKPTPADGSPIIRSGFEALDNLIGGFRGGRLIIIAARPGVGKSAFALAASLNAAENGYPSLTFNLEMSQEEIAERALAINSGVPLNRILNPPLTNEESRAVAQGRGVKGLYINDRADMTAAKIASISRRSIRKNGVKLIIVDYLQLLTPENPKDPRHLQVGQDTRRLKILARNCGVPVLCLCQMNREFEARGNDAEPQLSNLRDSGEIEQNADAVLFLWRDRTDQGDGPEQLIHCKLDKQRNGPTGKFELTYRRPCVRFENRGIKW